MRDWDVREHVSADAEDEAQIPWIWDLPEHIHPSVCWACAFLGLEVAAHGLDENRPHHGFTIIVGKESSLESCGKAGFNPFQGHNLSVIGSNRQVDMDTL